MSTKHHVRVTDVTEDKGKWYSFTHLCPDVRLRYNKEQGVDELEWTPLQKGVAILAEELESGHSLATIERWKQRGQWLDECAKAKPRKDKDGRSQVSDATFNEVQQRLATEEDAEYIEQMRRFMDQETTFLDFHEYIAERAREDVLGEEFLAKDDAKVVKIAARGQIRTALGYKKDEKTDA